MLKHIDEFSTRKIVWLSNRINQVPNPNLKTYNTKLYLHHTCLLHPLYLQCLASTGRARLVRAYGQIITQFFFAPHLQVEEMKEEKRKQTREHRPMMN